ncbi:MAG: VWA domain-containing protein, partial [Gammaproteobacteria bacterium]
MSRKRREFSAFSLSFLDIMSCGFGAVVLLFLIIKHQTEVANVPPPYDLNVEVEDLTAQLAAATSTVEELKQARLNQDQLISDAQSEVEKRRSRLAEARARAQ